MSGKIEIPVRKNRHIKHVKLNPIKYFKSSYKRKMIRTQPQITYVAIHDGDCKVLYLEKASNTFKAVQQLFPDKDIVLEVAIRGANCVLTVFINNRVFAYTKFNLKTLRVTPSKCPMDQLDMAMVRDDILK
jgi:hypothetical protein